MFEPTTDPLEYYRQHSVITDPGEHGDLLAGLTASLPDLVRVVQGVLIHPMEGDLYDIRFSSQQVEEERLRSVAQMLARIRALDASPLSRAREPAERLVGICRDYAVMLVALLRQQGIPARVRVGFSRYLGGEVENETHHVAETWDAAQRRWVLVDPQLDEAQRDAYQIDFDPLDVPAPGQFHLAGQAWQLCLAGKAKANAFGYNRRWKGWRIMRSSLLHDLNALNKVELLPWDIWGELIAKRETELTRADRDLLGRLADLTTGVSNGNPSALGELRDVYEELPDSRAVRSKLHLLGLSGDFVMADPDHLHAADADLLAAFQAVRPERARAKIAPVRADLTGADSEDVLVRGARQHNLRNIDVTIPRDKLVVITGVSGSGKSSLAFDTIYAEGRRRYIESFSAYARRFLDQIERPDVDQIVGLNPTVAIEQKTVGRNPRSTVGTITEVSDYLRVLFTHVGTQHCPQCGRAVRPLSARQIADQLGTLVPGTRYRLQAPSRRGREEGPPGDELVAPGDTLRVLDAVKTTLAAGNGALVVALEEGREILLDEENACPHCDIVLPELRPSMFSFNHPEGMCPDCNGLGTKLVVDPDLVITKPHLSLLEGASPWYGVLGEAEKTANWMRGEVYALAENWGVDLSLPWNELPERFRHGVLYGAGEERFRYTYTNEKRGRTGEIERPVMGAVNHINRLLRQGQGERSRKALMRFIRRQPCPTCGGERLCTEARFVAVGDKRLPQVTSMTVGEAYEWVTHLPQQLSAEQLAIGEQILREIGLRLQFLLDVGLHYLALDRPAPTLSGGEGQRIRLATQLGCGLVGIFYVLDEPSIGLHPRDHHALLRTLGQLRDAGNTVVVVEHDEDTMRAADWLIDLGPGAGVLGGELVAAGTPEEVMANPDSLTGRYLSGELQVTAPNGRQRRTPLRWLTITGARLHNLKGIDVRFPLGVFTCVTGVSGSGKSSLVSQTLHPALSRALHGAEVTPGAHDGIEGLDQIDKVVHITQSPIGRTPRSNPSTYVEVFDEIRKVYARTPDAKARGYKAGRFSFNSKGGRCEACQGHGRKQIEMHFLPDVWVPCQECEGKRYNRETLEIHYKGKTIADVLDMDVREALTFFGDHDKIVRILQTLHDVGLDYIKLGQSALTLSGGEAQRVKLAKELGRADTGRTFYILDEPTTGLHFADIQKLLDVLHRLVDAGNTAVVIEHNLDVCKTADWVIDLGPEGGDGGGQIVAQGPPEDVAQAAGSHTGQFLKRVLEQTVYG